MRAVGSIEDLAQSSPMEALVFLLEDIGATTGDLINAYYLKLDGTRSGERLCRWQRRTLSALRAALSAQAKTDASIIKLKRHMDSGT